MILRLVLAVALVAAAPATAVAAGTWESRSPAPLPRQEAALAALDGKLYFAGGFDGVAESARHEVYDVATDTWSPATPLPEPAHHLAGAAVGGRVYYLGGLRTLAFFPTNHLWEYDPAARTWALKASLPAARARGAGAVAVHDGRLVYVGGQRVVFDGLPRRVPVGEVDVYDPSTDAWTPLPDMPTPRDHLGAAVVGDTLYAVGGRRVGPNTEVPATEALHLGTGAWRTGLAPIPTPRGGFATAAIHREIVTVGGESPAGVNEQVEAYDPLTDRWRSLAPIPLPRHGVQGAAHAGGIWIAGGGTDMGVGATASLDVLYPGRHGTVAARPLGAPPRD